MGRRLPRPQYGLQIVNGSGQLSEAFHGLIGKQCTLIEQALDANDATDATQAAALEALNDTTIKANAAYELVGPGAYAIDATGTLPEDCRTALVDTSAGPVTVTLQPVAGMLGDVVVKKISADADAVTIEGDGAETIDGAANQSLTTQWESLTHRPALGAWYLI